LQSHFLTRKKHDVETAKFGKFLPQKWPELGHPTLVHNFILYSLPPLVVSIKDICKKRKSAF
jgi:hypothetical protein